MVFGQTVVVQFYESEVNNEYVIRGNAAVLKCSIPSFVADFVTVVSWQDDAGGSYTPADTYGNNYYHLQCNQLTLSCLFPCSLPTGAA